MPLTLGSRLGPYEILAPLGAGGMGEVYRARDTRLGREVAVKVLPALLSSDPDRLRRFEQEARAASALNHPNIVTLHDVGHQDGVPYFVQELLEGQTLGAALSGSPIPARRAADWAHQIAVGLSVAHARGIIHRDLKPENLFVTRDGRIKILDFGLAKLTRPDVPVGEQTNAPTMTGTQPNVVLGTIGYMSPEQALGRELDFRSDQFSFGSVVYELLTGKRAFLRGSPVETLAAIIKEEPEPPASLNAQLPAPLCWIVERCLAKDPEGRYASTEHMARDLAAVRERILEAAPTPAASRSGTASLPVQRTGFVGRAPQLAAVRELLLRPEVHIVTLTGPGGIGKTRLGLQVAEDLADRFPGGVAFAPLSPVADPDAMATVISHALRVPRDTGLPPHEALTEYLRGLPRAPLLLVLDGFERLMSGAWAVAAMVAAAPDLKILVTSRSPLHVYGEQEYPVPPLGLARSTPGAAAERSESSEAATLFLQRACAVKPDFEATPENAAAIDEICRRLDGLPLAIELAAARVKLLSPSAMRSRLEKRLGLLTGGARDLPERQRTLRGAIDWSHDLLSPEEQKLFRRLAVFVGGCTLEEVEAVCNAKTDLEIDPLEGVASMVDKSLLRQVESPAAESRFEMLQTIREYGLERLAASGDEDVTRRAHAAFCIVLAEEAEPRENADAAWLDRVELEHDNFRAALDWLTQTGNADWGLRLGAALFRFWEPREHLAEGRERLMRLLRLPAAAARNRGRARALFAAGVLAGEQGDYPSARTLLEESLDIDRELNDTWSVAVSLNALAVIAMDRGDVAEARSLFEENLALWRQLGDRAAIARSLSNLANVVKAQKDYAGARALYEEALGIFRELGDPTGVAWALDHQGDVAREQGDVAAARTLYEASVAAFRQLGDRWGIAGVLADLGNLTRDRGDYAGARALYAESLHAFRELEYKRGIARLLECFACAAAGEGQPERALRLAGAAAALRQALGVPLPRGEQEVLEKSLAGARQRLSDAAGAAAWMEGWAASADGAVAEALAE